MEYNLLPGAICDVNLVEGNKDIPFNDLIALVSYSDNPVTDLNESDVVVFDLDLGRRININRVEYKFETSFASNNSVASGIKFYYKNETFETEYTSVVTYTQGSDVYEASISGTNWSPRYIRIEHDLSDTYGITTITGSMYGFQVINNDKIIDFGEEGDLEEKIIEVARGGVADICTVPILNNDTRTVDALVNIEPTYTDIDTMISLSNAYEGPWVYPLNQDTLIFNFSTYTYGNISNVNCIYNSMRIDGWEDRNGLYTSNYESGTYTTRVFSRSSDNDISFILNRNYPQNGRISVDKEDPTETIEVRYNNNLPKNYSVFRELWSWQSGSYYNYSYRDRWSDTVDIKEESTAVFATTNQYVSLDNYQVVQDSITERWVGWFTSYGTSFAGLYIFNNIGDIYKVENLSTQSAQDTKVNTSWREIKLDSNGGIWCYFYCQGYSTSNFCDQTGYYLAYFNSNLEEQFKWFYLTQEIQDLDVDYDNNYLWYTRPDVDAIFKLDTSGTTLVSFSTSGEDVTHDLQGIVVLPDSQGVWFGNNGDLHRLNDSGAHLSEFAIEDVAQDYIKYIALDGDGSEALWILDGFTLGRFYISGEKIGTYDFRITLDYPLRLEPTDTGCWVYCTDLENIEQTHIRFVSKINKRLETEFIPSGVSRPGSLEITYSDVNYVNKMPVSVDQNWKNLEWEKVAIEDYLTSEDSYHQVRITLRRQEPVDRYDFVTDTDEDYFTRDQFDQDEAIPNQLLWQSWLDKDVGDGLDRVYVDTSNKELIMVPDNGGTEDSYIRTFNRVLTSADDNDFMEVRVSYKFGDGTSTGKDENLYIYGYPMDVDKESEYIAVRVSITSSDYVTTGSKCTSYDSNWYVENIGTSTDYYEGTIRIYCTDSDYIYGQSAPGSSDTFSSGALSYNWMANGTRWYWQIVSDRDGSQVTITDFYIRLGNNYFYTDSPEILSMYTQDLVSVENIAMGTSKNVYVKTQVPQDSQLDSNYETNIKVRWRTPVY